MSGDRLKWDEYFMDIAKSVSKRSSCMRRSVGAIIVVEQRIVSTGYNGTPFGVPNCNEGGCPRCASDAPSGTMLDECLCVHAEANALVLAARHGSSVNNGTLYSTLEPCLGCLKLLGQAGIGSMVFYEIYYPSSLFDLDAYCRLIAQMRMNFRTLNLPKRQEA